MPKGNYQQTDWRHAEGAQRPLGITEPHNLWERSHPSSGASAVQAKEPDRQSASRRGASSRGRSSRVSDYSEEASGQGRSSPRGSHRGTQARRAAERGTAPRRTAGSDVRAGRQKKSRRGFAAMSPEQQREIARKGGLTVSRNRRHMADIGRVGGEHSHGGRRGRR
jgi:general stress protein YciG